MDNYRIIGNCLQINAEILENRINSKLPKFIAIRQERHYRNKLIKTITRLKDSNMVLDRHNLTEFFTFIYNNYPPHGKYKSVLMCQLIPNKYETYDIEAVIKFDSYKAIISIDNSSEYSDGFDIVITKADINGSKDYTFHCESLKSSNENIKEHIDAVNKVLLQDMTSYIIDILSCYNRKEK